jgi:transposase
MEDLTGINLDPKKYFLRTWKYYQLQEFIKYKANQYGINIMWVNPSLTSLTCNTCKTHNKLNRTKENWSKFICNNIECDDLGKSIDADLNAAKNITELNGDNNKGKKKKLTKVIIEQHEMGI